MKLSIILPIYNEKDNLKELHREINEQLKRAAFEYEIIAVNDGSSDGSSEVLDNISKSDARFHVLHLSKNYGQTAALSAGIDFSKGDILILMDADLQNDPKDIPKFLEKINEGYDVVAGWRKNRKDNIVRRLPSVIASKIISLVTSVKLHDHGCTMKAYRREIIEDIRFYGEMHRFMPAYVAWEGARIYEMVVNHRQRIAGKSKYGILRTFKVVLDLLTVKFLTTYLAKPMHFFGSVGLGALFLGFISGISAIILRLNGVHFIKTPLPLLTIFLVTVGIQFILMGILAEILIRIYYEPNSKKTYRVRSKINFEK